MPELSPAERAEAFQCATQRVRARLGLVGHLALFLVVGLLLLVVNLAATPGAIWFFWPLLFWLVALATHTAVVLGPGARLMERWREREYAREIERKRAERTDCDSDREHAS